MAKVAQIRALFSSLKPNTSGNFFHGKNLTNYYQHSKDGRIHSPSPPLLKDSPEKSFETFFRWFIFLGEGGGGSRKSEE